MSGGVRPGVYDGAMGEVIDLAEYRGRRSGVPDALRRLDAAVRRLDPLIRARSGTVPAGIEAELTAIERDVSAGRPRLAAVRAERLASRLGHPAASGS